MGNILSCLCGGGGDDEIDESKLDFLHGRLKVHVIQAEGLPDTDTALFNIDRDDKTDAYVTADLGPARLFKSKYIANDLNPVWDEVFNFDVCHYASTLEVRVKDKEHVGASFIASTHIRVVDFIGGEVVDGWFDLLDGDSKKGRIKLSVEYTPKERLGEDGLELVNSYFPVRENNRVVLYQDADTPESPVFNGLTFPDGSLYKPTTAWRDLYEAIEAAEKFIYITGWSVYTEISLVRDTEELIQASHVGNLLKRKASQGVRVLLMVWNEKLSTEGSPGLMGTHDEETRLFFEDSLVECALMSRSKKEGALASEFVGTCYTHHQKTVMMDGPIEGSDKKRIVAFIGGLDITDGRYDTPEFPLWKTINNKHIGDFYSNCLAGVTKETGPRQPWHDCHAKLVGPAAIDLVQNFEERWRRQAEEKETCLYRMSDDDFSKEEPAEIPDYEGGSFHVQLFRSITTDSCIFDLDKQESLFRKAGKLVENSILRAMVLNIRNAKNFIYFENQYFLGSAYSWFGDQSTLTMHIVPREITQKVVDKIAAGEAFKVYILIPMFPEGDPASAAIQEILFWQYRTMETMYKRIGKAIVESGSNAHPTDYLNFYCLAKREAPDETREGEFSEPTEDLVKKVHKSRRHCIYVHSKMTIFDDQYVLVGSANVNQRSLGGNRDSEIAIGAYQNEHTVESEENPRGDVHTYRMALWAAHLGGMDEAYANPSSDECLTKVREVTQQYWDLYTADEPQHSDVHLLPYPIKIETDGTVNSLQSPWKYFPDTSAKVLGNKSGYLPGKLTT